MANLTLYLPDDLARELKAAAEADGRSVSNFAVMQLRAVMRDQFDPSHPAAVRELAELNRRQVDLEEVAGPGKLASAIARTVERGPQRPAARQPRRGK